MRSTLFLICPTDSLETIISETFKQESYFYTSLGNSFVPDHEALKSIKKLIQKHTISEIYFVLSENNTIISDALGNQSFSEIYSLKEFYQEILKQQERSNVFWQTGDRQSSVLSYFLNRKVHELQFELRNSNAYPVKIGAKTYDSNRGTFKDISSALFCLNEHYLN